MRIDVKITGAKAAIKNIKDKGEEMDVAVRDAIAKSIYDIAEEATNRVKVQTGRLKNSITPEVRESKKETIGEVSARTDYAAYVEFGTGTLVNVPKGLEDYAMQFKGKGVKQVNLPARPFLFPAFYKAVAELPTEIEKQLKAIGNK